MLAVVAVVALITTTIVVHLGSASHVRSHGEVAEGFGVLLGVASWLTSSLLACSVTLVVVLVVVVLVLVAVVASVVVAIVALLTLVRTAVMFALSVLTSAEKCRLAIAHELC